MSYNADNLKMPTIQLDEDILHGAGLGVFFRPSEIGKLGITYNQLGQLVGAGVVERGPARSLQTRQRRTD